MSLKIRLGISECLLGKPVRFDGGHKLDRFLMDVLMHMAGYFKNQLDHTEKAELLEIIDLYSRELVPLIVPITLINHYIRKYNQPYLQDQYYLNPHPIELQLRNHV